MKPKLFFSILLATPSGCKLILIFNLSKTPLATLNVNMHYLCTWKNIINIVQKNKILSVNEINNLKYFLSEPEKWRLTHE